MTDRPLRAILYARVSGDDTATGGGNIADQLRLCREYAEGKDYVVVDEVAEDVRGASGARTDLPGLEAVLERAERGDFDVLVVRELDRLSRNLAKQLVVEEELKRHGVTVAYALQDYPPTPEGDLMRHLRGSIAEFERAKIAERTARGLRRIVRSGQPMLHGKMPLGYRETGEEGDHTLVIDPETAPLVREIFARCAAGESARDIARALSARGVPTPTDRKNSPLRRRGYAKWSMTTIRRILDNDIYHGTWRYGAADADGSPLPPVTVPAIIDDDTWRAVRKRRAANRKGTPRTKRPYLLSGRLTCAECRHAMCACTIHSSGKVYLYYRCPTAAQKDRYIATCGTRKHYRAPDVDAAVWEWVAGLLTEPERLRAALAAQADERERRIAPVRAALKRREQELARHETAVNRLLDLYAEGDHAKEYVKAKIAEREVQAGVWRTEADALRRELEALETETPPVDAEAALAFAADFAAGLDEAAEDFALRRKVIQALDVRATLSATGDRTTIAVEAVLGAALLHLGDDTGPNTARPR